MSRPIPLDPKYDHYDFPTVSATKVSGHPGHTTPAQDAQVAQLRMMLEQAGFTERLDTLTLVCVLCYQQIPRTNQQGMDVRGINWLIIVFLFVV